MKDNVQTCKYCLNEYISFSISHLHQHSGYCSLSCNKNHVSDPKRIKPKIKKALIISAIITAPFILWYNVVSILK